ncbi:caspase family protein, partial [Thiohalorhabdus sp. Cl-TMA]
TIFPTRDGEWVAWTPEGFFDASEHGAQYIGYHLNRGPDKAADFVGVDQLYDAFYRPDLVAKKLAGQDISAQAERIDVAALLSGGLPPEVAILAPESGQGDARDVTLRYEVCDRGGGIGRTVLYLNGRAVGVTEGTRALKRVKAEGPEQGACYTRERPISLQPGANRIELAAATEAGGVTSERAGITVDWQGAQQEPDLHILAVAVNKYRDGDLRLEHATGDARALIEQLRARGQGLFRDIHVHTLFDAAVDRAGIAETFDEVGAQVNPEDVFVFFLAGHGVTNRQDGDYYFLPADFRYTSQSAVAEQGLSKGFFQESLARVPAGKALVLLDTCQSGAFA